MLSRQNEVGGKHRSHLGPGQGAEKHLSGFCVKPFLEGFQIRRRPQDLILCYVGLEACPGLWRGASGVEGVEKDSVLEHMA